MKFQMPATDAKGILSPQLVVALLATLMLLCSSATIQSRIAQVNQRVKLPQHRLAKLPPTAGREELDLAVAFPESTTPVRNRDMPLVSHREMQVPLDRIAPELERLKRDHLRHDPQHTSDHVTVIIRAEEDIPAGAVQQLVKTCQDAGFARFALKSAKGQP